MIVVDTNVLAYLWLPGDRTEPAERLLRSDPDWNAPLLWRSEFRNVLAGYLRRGHLDLETALQIADEAEAQMRGREFSVPSAQVLARVEGSDCSAYDCEFVVLAEELGAPLFTSDERLLRSFPGITKRLE
jgi:predicted nucleic acid-binding protein